MKKRLILLFTALILVFIAACSSNEDDTQKDDVSTDDAAAELASLNAELEVPETADSNEEVIFETAVKYDDELVEEADQVQYEVWKNGEKDDGKMIDAITEGDGTYTLEHKFEQDGNYTVQVHVDAHQLHTMPKVKIVIGEDSNEDIAHEHEFETDGFDLHFAEPENVQAGEDTDLMVHLEIKEKAFSDADVRYEIGQKNVEEKDWVDTEEENAGEYIATYKFEEAGIYDIVVHVVDDEDLHEHADFHIKVK